MKIQKFWKWTKNQADTERTLFLNGTIAEECWFDDDVTPQLFNGNYLWQPSVQAGQPDKILGYDVFTTPFAPTIAGGALAIAFGDFSNYWIGDRGGRTVQRLNELYATNGQVGYVATERVDGKVILPEAIKLLKMKS